MDEKDALLSVRIPAGLRKGFIKICADLDTTASREVRNFIRAFVRKNGQLEFEGMRGGKKNDKAGT